MRHALAVFAMTSWAIVPRIAGAGPPFVTDDPEPTAPQQWEMYAGYAAEGNDEGREGALPFVEANWGARRNLQLSLTIPYGFAEQDGGRERGFGDLELGVKLRFVPESRSRPQVAFYPLVTIPSGGASHHLGEGATAVFLPLWAQKNIGAISVYGGGGIWNRGGTAAARWGQTGIVVQATLGERVMVGGETYRVGAREPSEPPYTAVAIGAACAFSDRLRLLFSAGRSSRGAPHDTLYIAIETIAGGHH
jgi:hypothetical protein